MATQFGYFVVADITGYTQYLSESELDHAQQTLTALLNLLIRQTRPPLIISRLAGDAVISYALQDKFVDGQTFVEMLEDTYVAFRRQLELMVRNTTCPCNACRNIGGLDLKFLVHFGEFAVQKLDAHDELVGSDVNLLHRLLKNHVVEATGIRAYALYTDAAIRQLGLAGEVQGLTPHAESYEHLGEVAVWLADMHPVWASRREAVQPRVAAEQELFRFEAFVRAPPEVVWDHIVQPQHLNVLLGGERTEVAGRRRGRVSEGSTYQCFHGDSVVQNVVVGWRPFEQAVVQFAVPMPLDGAVSMVELRLVPEAGGTRLAEILGRASGPTLARLAADAGMQLRKETFHQLLKAFVAAVEADAAQRGVAAVQIAADEVAAAAHAAVAVGRGALPEP